MVYQDLAISVIRLSDPCSWAVRFHIIRGERMVKL